MKEIVIGIDIGGTNTALGVITRKGDILSETSIATDQYPNAAAFVEELARQIKNQVAMAGYGYKLAAIGIGAPNGNHYNGTVEHAPNLRWDGVVPLSEMIAAHFPIPVALTNDANAAAVGELIFGKGRGKKHFVVITLGTGLGSGFIIDGHVLHGHSGFAGEFGHTNVYPDGRRCTCGKRGCLEAYVSARGLKQTVTELLDASLTDSALRRYRSEELTAKAIYTAASNGDKIAQEAFEYTGSILGRQLADAVAVTSPEAIFLFGGLAQAGDFLLGPTREHFEANLLNVFRGNVALLLSGLNGRNAAILGSAALAWQTLGIQAHHNV